MHLLIAVKLPQLAQFLEVDHHEVSASGGLIPTEEKQHEVAMEKNPKLAVVAARLVSDETICGEVPAPRLVNNNNAHELYMDAPVQSAVR